MEVADGFGMDGALAVDAEMFSGEGTENAGSVGNRLAVALGEPTGCAVVSVQDFVDDGGRESWVSAMP